ncbi:MAG: EAL and HDOD domain-containing protein [Ilumatobacter sp.]|jgi:c-di-GMP phosphodiesterase|uniref:EAL and HDOD domain-containing protein n=1 Tax=Ilumatobacter sp. TaxID=1967498 RepID=UPI00391D76D5
MSNDIFLGRQPILDGYRDTFGYELLYRSGPNSTSFFDDPDDASRTVMERALLDWGMERIIGDRFGLINAGTSLIKNGIHRGLPPEGIIFEISVDETFDDSAVDAIEQARRDGYHFALDNVSALDQLQRSHLLPLVSIVKIEAGRVGTNDLPALVQYSRQEAPGVLMVAEKVETIQTFDACSLAGFDLFQGYFFAEPEVLGREARPTGSLSALKLMAEMQKGDLDINRTTELVSTDPSLAYRLLSVVNSSAFGLNRRVESIRHAIVMLGLNQVRHLATLLALSHNAESNEELIAMGATRGRLASQLEDDPSLRDSAFTVGLLSVTDAIFKTPMDELLADLPVSEEISEALIDGTGPFGRALRIVKACERSDVEELQELMPNRSEQLLEAYGEAISWANEVRQQLPTKRSAPKLLPPPNPRELVHR